MTDTDPVDSPPHRRTPGKGVSPEARPIEPSAPDEFGLVQLFWGDGKGKTTAAMGMGFRAAGHGFRVHMLQFMKGGADSVEDVRGEYNAIAATAGFTYENTGHYGWHALPDGSDEVDHQSDAQTGFERAQELIAAAAAADLTEPFALDGSPDDGVHMLQFMKGGADSVEDVRGEYNAIAAMPGFTYENTGHYGWHALPDGSDEDDHQSDAQTGFERAQELIAAAAAADLTKPFALDGSPDDGVHMLILDELLYAADRELVDPEAVVDLVETKPPNLELVITGSHSKPDYLYDSADLVTQIGKEKHPIDAGQRARRGTEY